MKLPNADKAIVPPEKLRDYLLSPSHPVGKFKEAFFRSMGFTKDHWRQLETAVRSLITQDAHLRKETAYGRKYEIRGTIIGPSGREALVITAWIVREGENIPRFITAYPED